MIKEKLLITGGSGFIGSNFINYILKNTDDIEIINYDCLTYASSSLNTLRFESNPRYSFIKGNILDSELIYNNLHKFSISKIINFAAESHVDNSIYDPKSFIETNINGTYSLLKSSLKYFESINSFKQNDFRFYQISTDEVYGSLDLHEKSFTETSIYKPNSPYAASKAGADHLVRAWNKTYGLPTLISCCSNNYGPFQHHEKLIPKIIKSVLDKSPIPIYGNGMNIRDWIYVDDHCSGVHAILNNGKPGETYNLGGGNELTNLEICKEICRRLQPFLDYDPLDLITFVEDRKGHDFRYSINYSKAYDELIWKPSTNFSNGLDMTIKYFTDLFQ